MPDGRPPFPYHKVVSLSLVLLNLVAVAYALYDGRGGGRWDYHFRAEGSFIIWLGSAEMFGACLLFLACYLAGTILQFAGDERSQNHTWLVFALGFFILALDQQFRLREHLTLLIDGPDSGGTTSTLLILKVIFAAVAIALVIYFRSTVLANFRMVVAFLGGFWFLVFMLLVNAFFDGLGLPSWMAKILEGTGKLLAMAMFLTGSYVALLDRLRAAYAVAQIGLYGERRKMQIPINFPDRRGKVEFGPLAQLTTPGGGLKVAAQAPEPAGDAATPEPVEQAQADADKEPEAETAPVPAPAASAAPEPAAPAPATTTTAEAKKPDVK
jgi:hypothetical protein